MSDFMAPCSSKRRPRGIEDDSSSSMMEKKRFRRREDDSSSSSTETKLWSLDSLNDNTLIEILTRLPTAKSAFALKMVCRRWCSIISSILYFMAKFINHHKNQKSSYDPHYAACQIPPAVFVSIDTSSRPIFFPAHADYKTYHDESGYKLEFLPEERKSVYVLASSNDLLLCGAERKDSMDVIDYYYICNPFTKQWLLLPPPPVIRQHDSRSYGLVCAPNHHQQQALYNFRFRAVRSTWSDRTKHSSVDVYCSETRQWNESVLLGERYQPHGNLVAHDGRLHWSNGRDAIVACDPFNDDDAKTILVENEEYKALASSIRNIDGSC